MTSEHSAGRQLLGRGSIYTLGAALQLLAAAIAIPAATRLLGSSEFGVVTLAVTSQTLLIPIAGLGLPVAILRFYFGQEGEREPLLARSLATSVPLLAFFVVGVALLTGLAWARALVPDDPNALLLGIGLSLPGATVGASMALLRAEERPFPYISVALISSVGAQALGIAALLVVDRNPLSYLAGYAIALVVAALFGLWLSGAIGTPPASRPFLRRALHYSLPTIPNTISIFVLAMGDRVVIQLIDGSSEVGKYQIGYAFGSIGIALITSLTNAWLPLTFGSANERRWDSLAETAATVTRLSAWAAGFLALVAATLLRFLVPSSYDPHLLADVSAIVALTTLPVAAFAAHSQVLLWTKHTRPLAVITPITATCNLILVAALLGPFGLRGAAAATVIAAVLQVVLTDIATRRLGLDVPWRQRQNLISCLLGAAGVALALLLPDDSVGDVLRLVGAGACALALLLTVLRQFRPAPKPEPVPTG